MQQGRAQGASRSGEMAHRAATRRVWAGIISLGSTSMTRLGIVIMDHRMKCSGGSGQNV